MHKNAIKKVGRVKIREKSSWKLVFSPFFWAFSPVFFVLFSSDIRDFQEKCSGNTAHLSQQQCCHFPCYNTNPVFLSWPPCWEFLLRVVTRNPKFPCFQRIPKKSSIFDQKLGIFVKKYVFSAKIFHSKSLIKIFFLKFVFSNGKFFCHKFWKKFVTFLQL